MDQFTEMMNTEFDTEANDYLDKFLEVFELMQLQRQSAGQDPMLIRDLAQKIMSEVCPRPDRISKFSVALAAAMFRLREGKS